MASCYLTTLDQTLDIGAFLHRYDFGVEQHTVQTNDGYLLALQRVIYKNSTKGPPVLLMHGIDGSSFDFMLNWPELSPALLLAKKGYDVWLGNNRGNFYSHGHAWVDT